MPALFELVKKNYNHRRHRYHRSRFLNCPYRSSPALTKPHLPTCAFSYNSKGGKIRSNSTSAAESLCRTGSGGPLCSICADDYYMSEYYGCLICSVGNAWLGPLLFIIVVLIAAAAGEPEVTRTTLTHRPPAISSQSVAPNPLRSPSPSPQAFFNQERIIVLYERHEARLLEFSQKATITFVTMQILIILNTTHKSGEFLRVATRSEQTYVTIGFVTRTSISMQWGARRSRRRTSIL